MNIDKVYECDIYRIEDIICDDIKVTVDRGNGYNFDTIRRIKYKTFFVKKALVYFSVLCGCFIDLQTKERYGLGYDKCTKGDLFVYIDKDKIYGKDIVGTDKKHYSKKKILKKYNEIKVCE